MYNSKVVFKNYSVEYHALKVLLSLYLANFQRVN